MGEAPLDFGYDLAGRITGLDQNGTAYDQGFGYDAADRLTSYTGYPALRAYTYDANGNRTRLTVGSASIDTQYNSGTNKMFMESGLAALPGGIFSAFQTSHWNSYDSAGNFVGPSHTFHYNIAGQLASVTSGGNAVTYQYDGLGRRVSKSGPATLVPGGFVRYVHDAAHHLVGEYKADGTPIKEYVWIGDLPVAVIETHPDSTTTAYAIETDHLGTPRLLTDATRAPRWRWTSPPFGEVLPEDDPSGLGAVTFNLRFPGHYYDKETGLHYNFNRYYDPERGRYVQSDPIGLQGGWNTYAYVGGNPISYSDPTGEVAQAVVIGGGAVLVGACISTNCTRPIAQAMQSVANSISSGINSIKEWCSDGPSREECKKECVTQYERDVEECGVAHAFWGKKGYQACMTRAGDYLAQCMRACDGK
ncbi:RHS repeat domain-containing protein [Denitromonas sp.]|uniref:RHS repeat domain-containing protein n=1 Tax=Denitromonas sp. TaxID=2734609 RepID=UPI003A89F58D